MFSQSRKISQSHIMIIIKDLKLFYRLIVKSAQFNPMRDRLIYLEERMGLTNPRLFKSFYLRKVNSKVVSWKTAVDRQINRYKFNVFGRIRDYDEISVSRPEQATIVSGVLIFIQKLHQYLTHHHIIIHNTVSKARKIHTPYLGFQKSSLHFPGLILGITRNLRNLHKNALIIST